ncbi:flagella basal body P-ring formation protein FlgA [Candidatus Kryptonium thompsonii]|jgi:flagella basal body P-ring formation protein FlgA|uniref:Flagella basal body P-ring formation protein FlgA n=2 Tax=Candidatus Kryptonium thompsonii TaxID=1633631 RepID=A0A0P1L6Q9_9BACT|nr:flagellar basal body P-ring formation chaperone FlgA [Candidatus Kryptonium thompsoni]CUS76566.1 flagella basal body P-ring formation protein FlgA [Candidatus Kryptonium thompsoni]CUS76661.1 flagella basal body P-ring formation protein FlgA [Candidatus Kryptonium thompsoni]CUS82757.1 flagella basal body P-ring formation protein FlgA [Candidatus Kryptonium thompsoni]CUS82993.1 flagella basal body P-ring formation protein FlgA [Candidatus Kryptonium thompsoni]CUS84006.1 flagella basal body P-
MIYAFVKIFLLILLQNFFHGSEDKLKSEIVNYLRGKFPDKKVNYLIELKGVGWNIQNLENCDVKVVKGGSNYRGYQTFKVQICSDDSVREIFISALVRTFEDVLVARGKLKRGIVIDSKDKIFDLFLLERVETTFLRDGYVCDVSKVLGKEIKKPVREGEIIFESYFEDLPLVKAGERVRVVAKAGNVKIETIGIAKRDGRLNERVRVVNPESGKLFYGKVIGEGIVEVEIEN